MIPENEPTGIQHADDLTLFFFDPVTAPKHSHSCSQLSAWLPVGSSSSPAFSTAARRRGWVRESHPLTLESLDAALVGE